jgi:hypothetical protein
MLSACRRSLQISAFLETFYTLARRAAIGHKRLLDNWRRVMQEKRYWCPVRPANNGWGWGLPLVWQGWVVVVAFFVLLIGGSIVLAPHGMLGLIANGFVSGGFLLSMACWKGEPQRNRNNGAP